MVVQAIVVSVVIAIVHVVKVGIVGANDTVVVGKFVAVGLVGHCSVVCETNV